MFPPIYFKSNIKGIKILSMSFSAEVFETSKTVELANATQAT